MLFSVILPVYNVASYLDRCLQSVLRQDFADYEIILVDDGSTDTSGEICDRYADQYAHIRVIHKENGGLSSARNAGLEAAEGAYLWWVDSDDWIEEDSLQRLYGAVCDGTADMVKFSFTRMNGQNAQPFASNAVPGSYHGREAVDRLLELALLQPGEFCLSAWSHVYRREFVLRRGLRFVSERLVGSEDYLFNLQAFALAENVAVLDGRLYRYDLRMGSLTQRYKTDLPRRYTELLHRLTECYGAMGRLPEYYGKICCFYVWHLLHGTCLSNEYEACGDHTVKQGRKNVRQLLGRAETRRAVRGCFVRHFGIRQKIQIWAMGLGLEPLFYWLYVKKPAKKKGILHEG